MMDSDIFGFIAGAIVIGLIIFFESFKNFNIDKWLESKPKAYKPKESSQNSVKKENNPVVSKTNKMTRKSNNLWKKS